MVITECCLSDLQRRSENDSGTISASNEPGVPWENTGWSSTVCIDRGNGFYSYRAGFGKEFLNGSSVLHHLSAEGQKAKGTFSKKLSKLFSISYGSALTTAN